VTSSSHCSPFALSSRDSIKKKGDIQSHTHLKKEGKHTHKERKRKIAKSPIKAQRAYFRVRVRVKPSLIEKGYF
jgi:hypothetical protein